MKKTQAPLFLTEFVLLAAGLCGFFLIIIATSRHGAGISPDSVNYIQCARSIAVGNGITNVFGEPFVTWPPLFSAILAVYCGPIVKDKKFNI